MNKLSTLPVGYKPTNLSQIRTYCQGNNGAFVKHQARIMTYPWTTSDGPVFEVNDGTNCGVTVHNTNICSSSKSSGWRMSRLGNKSGRATWFYGDYESFTLNGLHGEAVGRAAFIPHVVGITFKFSKADTRTTRDLTRKQNTNTECRIQKVAGVYIQHSDYWNGYFRTFMYDNVATGSLGFNASGIESNDKFCCYTIDPNSWAHGQIHNNPMFLVGWLFDLNFNHNGTGEQNPSGQFWQARPIVSLEGLGDTNKPKFQLAYPFETRWADFNPSSGAKMLKLNQLRA